ALIDHRGTGRAFQGDVVGAVGEFLHGPLSHTLSDPHVVGCNAGGVQVSVVRLDATVNQYHGDLGFLSPLQRGLPPRPHGGREQDDVDARVHEGRESIDLRLLVEVDGGCVLQVEARIFGERLLNVRLVRLPPCPFRADRDETDGGQLIAASGSAVGAGAAGTEGQRHRSGGSETDRGAKTLGNSHLYSSLSLCGRHGRELPGPTGPVELTTLISVRANNLRIKPRS